jgi:hypothetical protein
MSNISAALEAWRHAVREAETATPGTPEWFEARDAEEARRAEYQRIAAMSQAERRQRSDGTVTKVEDRSPGDDLVDLARY